MPNKGKASQSIPPCALQLHVLGKCKAVEVHAPFIKPHQALGYPSRPLFFLFAHNQILLAFLFVHHQTSMTLLFGYNQTFLFRHQQTTTTPICHQPYQQPQSNTKGSGAHILFPPHFTLRHFPRYWMRTKDSSSILGKAMSNQ